jgi:hypothetical protein
VSLKHPFLYRHTVVEESAQTLQGVINTSLDTSSILGEMEVRETKKKKMEQTLTVLTINPLTDEDTGLDQSTSDLVKKKEGTEDTVEIMVEEGKVLFVPKIENEDLYYN